MIKPSPRRQGLIQSAFIIIFALIAWQVLHHSPDISQDIYPYLGSISPELVKQCVIESRTASATTLTTNNFEEFLAIRSTLSGKDAQRLIDQLKDKISFSNLNWGMIPSKTVKLVQRNRIIIKKYPYYYPDRYEFPVIGTTWFEDSFGSDREGGKRKHEGTDLFGKEGTPIVSICGGEIEQIGWNRLGGERVGVRGDDGNYYYYAHLQYISSSLRKGNRIAAGESIGTMGHTGDALTTPDHLHFGIELPNGQWINPYPFLAVWKLWGKEELR